MYIILYIYILSKNIVYIYSVYIYIYIVYIYILYIYIQHDVTPPLKEPLLQVSVDSSPESPRTASPAPGNQQNLASISVQQTYGALGPTGRGGLGPGPWQWLVFPVRKSTMSGKNRPEIMNLLGCLGRK